MAGDQTVAFRESGVTTDHNKVLPGNSHNRSLVIDVGTELLLASTVLDV